jgi:cytoskeletal protein CcmA (bactofilin family)
LAAALNPPAQKTALEHLERGIMANIGKSIAIKGDVSGDEDLVIEGRVEGRIELKNHQLTVGPNGEVKAEVAAKQVTIIGRVSGNVVATERLEIQESGRIDGDVQAPVLVVQEGAIVNGTVTMKVSGAGASASAHAVHGPKAVPDAKPRELAAAPR